MNHLVTPQKMTLTVLIFCDSILIKILKGIKEENFMAPFYG